MPRLTPQERERALGRLQAGQSAREVANLLNCHISTVFRLHGRFQATNTTTDRPRTGRPRVTSGRQDRQIVRQHVQEPFQSARDTARATLGTHRRPISADTVRRRLQERDLVCRRPARGPRLSPQHRQNRLQWAQARINWRHQQWGQILFTDECRFCVSRADGRVRVWRRRGTRYADGNVLEMDPWGGPNIMVWGAIGLQQKLDLVLFQNVGQGRGHGITAQVYINQVLQPRIVPFFHTHPNFVLQQDNARPHVARVTRDFLQQNRVRTLPWPAYSPDLNPIEHLWDEVKRRINRRRPAPITAAQLAIAVEEEWRNLPMAVINRLVHSMYRRCAAVVVAQGGHTRY